MGTIRVERGQCLCGRVSVEATGEPLWVAHCHCVSCRRHTGAAVATFVGYREPQVRFPAEPPSIYVSSPGVRRGFCAHCGSTLSYQSQRCAGEIHLHLSLFDEPAGFIPQVHVFCAERIAWLELHDDLPRYRGTGSAEAADGYGPTRAG